MLAIEVSFLLGRYTATDFRDRDTPEWPPHPCRLFSALVAAAAGCGLGESAKAALLWLEAQAPPVLHADAEAAPQSTVTAYVPVNDATDDLLPDTRVRQARSFPSSVPATTEAGTAPSVWFIWPDATPDAALHDLLTAIAQNVTYLGSSHSPVRVRLTDNPPAGNWVPDDRGPTVLRVPHRGRLNTLSWHYDQGLRPPVGAFQRYRFGSPAEPGTVVTDGPFHELVVYRMGGPAVMPIEASVRLTEAFRAAVMSRAAQLTPAISGHDDHGNPTSDPHVAYLALPFVSDQQRHADGHILGLAAALPRDLAFEDRRRVMEPLLDVDHLRLAGVGRVDLERVKPGQPVPYNLRPNTWVRSATSWASVTPVLFDRFPKRHGRGAEALIAKSCTMADLPAPSDVTVSQFSPFYGVEPSFRYVVRRSKAEQDQPRLYAHVTLTFDRPVRGPVLVGAGRFFGLGLFRPLEQENA